MFELNIFGAGLYGIFLAKLINDKNSNKKTQVNLFEKSSTILTAWNSKKIDDYSINNGFHGIEMPRAKKTADILFSLGCKSLLEELPNIRLIAINRTLIRFDSSLREWPEMLQKDYFIY